jgi:hypothetical protein
MRVFRCESCGRLLNDRLIRKGNCKGHRVRNAVYGTFGEWVKVKIWQGMAILKIK